jgi:phage shock protein A
VEASLKELVEKVAKVTVAFEEEKARRAQVQEYNKELRELIDKLRTQVTEVQHGHDEVLDKYSQQYHLNITFNDRNQC